MSINIEFTYGKYVVTFQFELNSQQQNLCK
jgi:hypothetical protein